MVPSLPLTAMDKVDKQKLKEDISQKLRAEGKIPENLPLVDLPAEGPLVQWAAFEREAADKIAAAGVLENMDVSPLPMNDALKILLMKKEGNRHD